MRWSIRENFVNSNTLSSHLLLFGLFVVVAGQAEMPRYPEHSEAEGSGFNLQGPMDST